MANKKAKGRNDNFHILPKDEIGKQSNKDSTHNQSSEKAKGQFSRLALDSTKSQLTKHQLTKHSATRNTFQWFIHFALLCDSAVS